MEANSHQYKVAICMPCYGRPERTKRAIESILAQNMNGWEAYIVGDGCPDFEHLMNENRKLGDQSWEKRAEAAGNKIWMWNAKKREGFYGYAIRNHVMHNNNSVFFLFLDNDDQFKPNHLSNYYNGIADSKLDFMYFNTDARFAGYIRGAQMEHGMIGHAELIIRSVFMKRTGIMQQPVYGHDWIMIEAMVNAGAKFAKGDGPPTYIIMGAGELREKEID